MTEPQIRKKSVDEWHEEIQGEARSREGVIEEEPIDVQPVSPAPKAEKKYGKYQAFNKKCLARINENDPNSQSLIEGIEGNPIDSVNERLAKCGGLWTTYRSSEDPNRALDRRYLFELRERKKIPPEELVRRVEGKSE